MSLQNPQKPSKNPTPKAISLEGPEEAVALCGWRLHRALEPWEIAEPPARVEEDGEEGRAKGRGKGKAKGPRMEIFWEKFCDFSVTFLMGIRFRMMNIDELWDGMVGNRWMYRASGDFLKG